MTFEEFCDKTQEGILEFFDRIIAWIKTVFVPELKQFLSENMPLIEKVVLELATDQFAAWTGAQKQAEANKRIKEHLIESVPDLKTHESWINLGIELAIQGLKASGKLK